MTWRNSGFWNQNNPWCSTGYKLGNPQNNQRTKGPVHQEDRGSQELLTKCCLGLLNPWVTCSVLHTYSQPCKTEVAHGHVLPSPKPTHFLSCHIIVTHSHEPGLITWFKLKALIQYCVVWEGGLILKKKYKGSYKTYGCLQQRFTLRLRQHFSSDNKENISSQAEESTENKLSTFCSWSLPYFTFVLRKACKQSAVSFSLPEERKQRSAWLGSVAPPSSSMTPDALPLHPSECVFQSCTVSNMPG